MVSMLHAVAMSPASTNSHRPRTYLGEYPCLLRTMTDHFTSQEWLELAVMSKDFGNDTFSAKFTDN